MEKTEHLLAMRAVKRGLKQKNSPIPCEGEWVHATQVHDISGVSHGVGYCATLQGTCKLSLNVKKGMIEECLIEVIGCSGMAQSAAMASEILTDRNLYEALNTDLVCDSINMAIREALLHFSYGRSQTAFSKSGLPVGSLLEELGARGCSQIGTVYGSKDKGPRYLFMNEGYVTSMALDEDSEVIGYELLDVGKMLDLIKNGNSADDALAKSKEHVGRYSEAKSYIDPRKE
jgi:NifU-like protein involved in Fe-S cluster formation